VILEEDEVWKWNPLSKIVQQINQTGLWTASLLTTDGPAVRLCRQQNADRQMPYECVVSEIGLIALGRSDRHRIGDDTVCSVRVEVPPKPPLNDAASPPPLGASRRKVKKASRGREAIVDLGRSRVRDKPEAGNPGPSPRSVIQADAP